MLISDERMVLPVSILVAVLQSWSIRYKELALLNVMRSKVMRSTYRYAANALELLASSRTNFRLNSIFLSAISFRS